MHAVFNTYELYLAIGHIQALIDQCFETELLTYETQEPEQSWENVKSFIAKVVLEDEREKRAIVEERYNSDNWMGKRKER